MGAKTPFDIPEIFNRLQLNQALVDYVHCIQVCKDWKSQLESLLWKQVEFSGDEVIGRRNGFLLNPPLEILHKHLGKVESLRFMDGLTPNLSMLFCMNLTKLHVSMYSNYGSSTCILSFFLLRNFGLTDVTLQNCRFTHDSKLWENLCEQYRIKKLTLSEVATPRAGMDDFRALVSSLDELVLDATIFPDGEDYTWPDSKFENTQRLVLDQVFGITPKEQVGMIGACPKLKDLRWFIPKFDDEDEDELALHQQAMDEFVSLVEAGSFPSLEILRIIYFLVSDADIARVINNMQRVTTLNLIGSDFGDISFQALQRHWTTLETLGVSLCKNVTSAQIQKILASCPNLRVLTGDDILAEDIINGQPWVCTSLKELIINIQFSPTAEKSDHMAVFESISALKKLELLNITGYSGRKIVPLNLSLEYGLEKLAGLTCLLQLCFQHSEQNIEMEEIDWMLEHWKSLEGVRGRPNGNEDVNEAIMEKLKSNKVRLVM
ncbi:hypothetical protein BGZ46_007872 [Entomortierella lignicola]|nr:hypothetical protein BGZ46_007872 [Entomortierella lignicola]